ncbi:putative NRPS-like protein biosynthetic cluster [Elasticomyces elasticus]|nr:putative NRPS-like protein biosynthetic cluster [Elasticomyces elasticus]
MAPAAIADLVNDEETEQLEHCEVLPSKESDARLRELWYEHGHPWSEKYEDPTLTTVTSLLGYNARTRPNDIGFLHPEGTSFIPVSWREFETIVHTLAFGYSRLFRTQIDAGNVTEHQPTIALLGSGHTYEYFATQLALLHLGLRVLLLSPSNADVARDHLLTTCDAVGIVVQAELKAGLQQIYLPAITMIPLPSFSGGTSTHDIEGFRPFDPWNSHSLIIHSSGTTGLPKPVYHTNRSMMLIARMYRLLPSFAIDNWYLLFPLFHIAGVSIALSGLPTGLTLTLPPTNWPPAPSAILNAWRELEAMGRPAECVHCAPAVIDDLYEFLSHNGGDFLPLTKLKVLQPGGAALSPLLLKKLVALGCNVKTTYGSTEIGPPLRTVPHTRDNVHCYRVRNMYPNSPYLEMQAQGEGLSELLVYKGFPLAAELWPTQDSANPYRTNDLFLEQPPGSGLFVLQGRKDDLLVHSNGEKTNALALQMALDSCPSISKSAVFGTGRAATAAIIEIVDNANEEETLDTIEQICSGFPTHSRLSRSLVYILTKGRTLPVTPKGSVRRTEVEKLYGAEIEEMYRKLECGDQAMPSDSDEKNLSDQAFVLQSVQGVLGRNDISLNANFYRVGLDSQKALRLRSTLMKRFGRFPIHLVFESPSVAELVQSLRAAPSTAGKDSARSKRQQWMRDAVTRYCAQIGQLPSQFSTQQDQNGDGEVVYLTGATGALGNALIEAFVANPKIQKVYCAARGGQQRLVKELTDRGYPNTLAQSSKLKAVPYVMSDPHLGLDADTYMEMAADTTIVVHGAWKLNFNMPVSEFEHDCVVGTMHLLRFATTVRQKTFSFCSSVATHLGAGAAGQMVPEDEAPDNMTLALDTGYAQSKLVTERILQAYARHTKLPVKVFRIGQLCGHTRTSAWNRTEMFPIMLVTGIRHLQAMPVLQGELVDWLPVDICAKSVVSLLTQTNESPLASDDAKSDVHNLVNPNAITWLQFLDVLEEASDVAFARVSMAEWVSKLQEASSSDDKIPGAKLIGFFEDMAKESMPARPIFSTVRTAQEVPALAATSEMSALLLRVYLERWRRSEFL